MKIEAFFVARVFRLKKFLLFALVCIALPLLHATNAPPMINIVTPASGSVLFAPEILTIAATASDDATVTNLSFVVNGAVITNALNEPFLTLSNPIAGSYVFRAVAVDDGGLATTSAPVNIEVITNDVAQVGSIVLNRSTGLLEQYVTVTNRTSEVWPNGVRLSVDNLGSTNKVWNATGTNAGVPYLEKIAAVPPGGSVQFLVQIYVPFPRVVPMPTFVGVPLPFSRVLEVPQITSITPAGNLVNVQFTTQSGKFYFIQSTENFITWTTEPTAMPGTGGTILAPESASADNRYYRVVMVP
jgi:hypothetical protein